MLGDILGQWSGGLVGLVDRVPGSKAYCRECI